jgi:hypothetical protein
MKIRLAAAVVVAVAGARARAQPANNGCASAVPITLSASYVTVSGTTVAATADGSSNCTANAGSPDVWYSISLPEAASVTFQTCGGATWDTLLSLHSACPGTTANMVGCNNSACSAQSSLSANLSAHTTYYLRVAGNNSLTSGPFVLTVSRTTPPPPPLPPPPLNGGPDVIVGRLLDLQYYGQVGDILAYAIGTDACNGGSTTIPWVGSTNHHPLVAQNFYRLKDGRFEQIGASWLKHTYTAANGSSCWPCAGGSGGLLPGCDDAYVGVANGEQARLGPRSQVNATSGAYPYPFSAPAAPATIGRRLQVHFADMDPAQNVGARYYAEAQYITPDDAAYVGGGQAVNGLNNCSWRGTFVLGTGYAPAWDGQTEPMEPAVFAWRAADPSVSVNEADYLDGGITARFWVGAKVTANPGGTWTYEYAVQNLNADRSGGSFSVPFPAFATASAVGFHGTFCHSGEPYENTATNPAAWAASVAPGSGITWACTPYAQNVNANALRWGTLYNFRFTTDVPPDANGSVTIGLFTPPSAGSIATSALAGAPVPRMCGTADFDGNGDVGTDADIEAFFACLSGDCCASCDVRGADFNGDGDVGTDADIEAFFRVLAGGAC